MSKRIGKYKIGKKENTLSAFGDEGGTIPGPVTLSGVTTLSNATIKFSGLAAAPVSTSLASNQVFRTGSAFVTASEAGALNVSEKLFDILCITK